MDRRGLLQTGGVRAALSNSQEIFSASNVSACFGQDITATIDNIVPEPSV